MTQSPCLPEPKKHAPIYPDESREDQYAAGRYVTGWNDCHTAFMTALAAIPLSCRDSHEASLKYAEGYEAGSAAAAQAAWQPIGWQFRFVFPTHASNWRSVMELPMSEIGAGNGYHYETRLVYAAAPTQGAEGAAPQAVGHVDYSALEGPLEELVRYCNNDDMLCNASEVIAAEAALETVYKARIAAQCVCQACKNGTIHASDCSVHGSDSGSGIARGPCDCGAALTPSPTPAAPQEADALREALSAIAGMTYDSWTNGAMAQQIARAALAQHQPQQGEQHE